MSQVWASLRVAVFVEWSYYDEVCHLSCPSKVGSSRVCVVSPTKRREEIHRERVNSPGPKADEFCLAGGQGVVFDLVRNATRDEPLS